MIGKQLEVLGIYIELSRACINSDVSDLPFGIGLNIRYSTNCTVIIQLCINR